MVKTTTDKRYTDLRSKLDKSVSRRRPLVADVELTEAYIAGNQWVSATTSRGLVPIANENDEIRVTDNRMLPQWVRWNYYLFQGEPVVVAYEGGHELRDAERARVASALCDYWENMCGFRKARREMMNWVGVAGIGFLAPRWNAKARPVRVTGMELDPNGNEEGGKIKFTRHVEHEGWKGELELSAYNPLQVHTFPLDAKNWQQVSSIIIADLVTEVDVKEIAPKLDLESLLAVRPGEINAEACERSNNFVSSALGSMVEEMVDKRYLRMQYFERPSREHKSGRFIVTLGDQVVSEEALPFLDAAREIDPADAQNLTMGIVPCFACDMSWRLIPPAPFAQMRDSQTRWNNLLTDQEVNRRAAAKNKLLYEEDSIDADNWTDEAAQLVKVRPGSSAPQWVQAPPLAGIDNEKAGILDSMQESTGLLDVLRGNNPSNVRAAFHLDILRQEAMTRIYAVVEQHEMAYEKCMLLCLAIAKAKYEVARVIEIHGQDYAGDALSFESAVIPMDVRLKTGSLKPRNFATVEAKLVELLQYGAFDGNIKMFWEMTELGTLNRSVDHEQKHRLRARRENVLMLSSVLCAPYEHEDHDLHLEEHRGFMARPEWYSADDKAKALFLSHLENHREFAIDQSAPQANIAPDPVAGIADAAKMMPGGKMGSMGAMGKGQGQPNIGFESAVQ